MVVFFLEEVSARELLIGLLPRVLPSNVRFQFIVFDGKQDLERQVVRKLRGWQAPDSAFVILRDQDAADCHRVREKLSELVEESGRDRCLVRVACRELESWVAGDWPAVADAFEDPQLADLGVKERFRNPDLLSNPIEEIQRHVPGYQKVDGARRLGTRIEPTRNKSPSFRAFCSGLLRLVSPAWKPST